MERRKKGSGQITHVPGRKSPWRACVVDSTEKQKSRFFKTEKEAKAFLREVNEDANKLKSLLETGVSLRAFSEIFLQEKAKENMKPTAYKTLELNIGRVCDKLRHVMLRDIDSDMVQQLVFDLGKEGYSKSVMEKSKIAIGSMMKMAAAKHYLDTVSVLNITIPNAKTQDADKLAKNNWMRDDEIRAYEEDVSRTNPKIQSRDPYCYGASADCTIHSRNHGLTKLHTASVFSAIQASSKQATAHRLVGGCSFGPITQHMFRFFRCLLTVEAIAGFTNERQC